MAENQIKHYNFTVLLGNNTGFMNCVKLAKQASKSPVTVLISGETGTGKELIAQSIHYESYRANCNFLAQNCAAIPIGLFEGILFGTEKGGFTGAINREGIFEQADKGTLLLDEISAMPYGLQGKLLRVLEEEYIRRVGGTKDIPVDVRVIATINEEAEELIRCNRLREDLYYRLNIIRINMPPLRERKDDILLLANKFIEKYNNKFNKNISSISSKAEKMLLNYDYPGNIRELENFIMAAISLVEDKNVLTEKDIFR
ncbi:MAG TPA: sigma 54-interacting transcriptional regulator [Clostridia bacterium]|nr:sigma 54-interacting transcriptional regulator [Clostridia bacterium]